MKDSQATLRPRKDFAGTTLFFPGVPEHAQFSEGTILQTGAGSNGSPGLSHNTNRVLCFFMLRKKCRRRKEDTLTMPGKVFPADFSVFNTMEAAAI